MEIKITIDDDYIKDLVSQEIAKRIVNGTSSEHFEAKMSIRRGIEKGVKEYIYSEKENIVNKVIDRASVEIVKKSLPRLLEKLEDIGDRK